METMETLKIHSFILFFLCIYVWMHLFISFLSGGSWYKARGLYLGNVPELPQQTMSQTRGGACLCGAVSEQSPTAMTQIQ